MKKCCTVQAFVQPEKINAYTVPSGPRGNGIKTITQYGNQIIVTYDNDKQDILNFPDWWFGTRAQYNALTREERNKYYLYFIEEGS